MMYSSSIFLKLSGELHSLIALGRLLNSLGPIDVKKLYLRVSILLLRAFKHLGLGQCTGELFYHCSGTVA